MCDKTSWFVGGLFFFTVGIAASTCSSDIGEIGDDGSSDGSTESDEGSSSDADGDADGDTDGDGDGDMDGDADGDGDGDADGDADGDTDGDADGDADGDGFVLGDAACPKISWGAGTSVLGPGTTLSNWVLPGYIDQNGDGTLETEEVNFDLCWVHHTGKQSAVLVVGDTA